jgi:hypothetical protein
MLHHCLIDLVGAEWWGVLVFTDSQNRLHTHPCHPLDQRPLSSRAPLVLASQPRARTMRTLLGYQLPPRAVATPRSLSVGDLLQRRGASLPNLSDDRQYVVGEPISLGLASFATAATARSEVGAHAPWLLPALTWYAARSSCALVLPRPRRCAA